MITMFDLQIREHFLNKNFDRGRSTRIRQIVIHHNAAHGQDPYQTWQTREASAHYQVWGDGRIDQLVHLNDVAWHAHEANPYTVGIEHENSSTGGNWPIGDPGLHASAKLVGYLCYKLGLGVPAYLRNITTHRKIETDGIGFDSYTACPGPYFIRILETPNHWYWAEAKKAYYRARGGFITPSPTAEKIYQGMGVPGLIRQGSGQYLGLITGPAESHGGANAEEHEIVKALQRRLIACGFVPGFTNPYSTWADGKFEEATRQAVIRFQKKHMPGTTYWGQVWYDDWKKLFNL